MKFRLIIVWIVLVATPLLFSCATTSNPQVENCKIGCESRARHSSDFVANCKRMCERYDRK